MNAVILVGGGGTRLRPLTYAVPKPLIPVVNRPLIVHIIENLRRHGVDNIVLAASEADKRIEEALGNGRDFGVTISYSYETQPLGSGLAVKQAAQRFDTAFFVCNGDVITDIDLSLMALRHREHAAVLSIALGAVDDPSAFGVAALGDGDKITRFVEKPPRGDAPSNWANAGTWLFEPAVLDFIPDEKMDRSLEQLVFPMLIADGFRVQGYPSKAYWMDVGTSERYLQLHRDMLSGALSSWSNGHGPGPECIVAADARLDEDVILGAGCHVGSAAGLAGPAVLGAACQISDGALVAGSVLWDDVRIGAGATIRESVLGAACVVGEGATIEGAVLANGARVGPGVHLGSGARLEPGEVAT